ncbi:MAG: hypothetical protein WC663_02460 [Patescibacteria group bacterium]|jgi:hypothetical protein
MGRKKLAKDPAVDSETEGKPSVDEESDKYKNFVIYIVSDLRNEFRVRMNRQLMQTYTVIQVTDIHAANNDLMDGVASKIKIVLYAEEVGGQIIGPQVVELCQMKGIPHLPLCKDLCDQIIADPCCILP